MNRQDVTAGLLVVAVGVFSLFEASRFAIGTAARMGPGYFPFILGLLMIGLGLAIALIEPPTPGKQNDTDPAYRPLLFVLGAMLAFALLVEGLGFAAAVALATFLGAKADRNTSLLTAAILSIAVTGICLVVFRLLLGLRIEILA